jgi:hypothetical protein
VSVTEDVSDPAGVAEEAQWTSRRSLSRPIRAACWAWNRLFMSASALVALAKTVVSPPMTTPRIARTVNSSISE